MGNETTALPPGLEQKFDAWLRHNHVTDLDHPDSHYDYRGAFLAGMGRETGDHFPDTFKQHGHPTFSIESKYSSGPGDGGSWDGERFIPQRAMTDPGPRFLPGQSPVPYGMTAGVRHVMPGINDQAQAPYGMTPGVRHVIPDQIDLDSTPEPEQVNLDEQPPPKAPAVEATHKLKSIRVKNANGDVVADMPMNPNTGNDYLKFQVQQIGDSLQKQAVTDSDRQSALRATQYGLSLVGLMPIKDIQSAIVHRYDTDERNDISRETQRQKNERAKLMGHGGPVGPTKADKFAHTLSGDLMDRVDKVVGQDRTATKYNAITEQENNIAQAEKLLSSPNAMGQRIAVQRQLLELTGKASRESEQAAITGAAGKWNELANKLSLWTSDDPQLTKQYIAEFRQMLASQRQYISEQKEKLGRETGAAVYAETAGYPDEDRQAAADAAYGRMTGKHARAYVPAGERQQSGSAAPQPSATPSGAVSPHLQKFLK